MANENGDLILRSYRLVDRYYAPCNLVREQGAQYLNNVEVRKCLQINPPPGSELKYTTYDNTTFEYLMNSFRQKNNTSLYLSRL